MKRGPQCRYGAGRDVASRPAPSPPGTEMDLVLLRAGKGDYLIQHHSALYFNEKTVHS